MLITMLWQDEEEIEKLKAENYAITIDHVTEKKIVFKFNFTRPELVSTVGLDPDEV